MRCDPLRVTIFDSTILFEQQLLLLSDREGVDAFRDQGDSGRPVSTGSRPCVGAKPAFADSDEPGGRSSAIHLRLGRPGCATKIMRSPGVDSVCGFNREAALHALKHLSGDLRPSVLADARANEDGRGARIRTASTGGSKPAGCGMRNPPSRVGAGTEPKGPTGRLFYYAEARVVLEYCGRCCACLCDRDGHSEFPEDYRF